MLNDTFPLSTLLPFILLPVASQLERPFLPPFLPLFRETDGRPAFLLVVTLFKVGHSVSLNAESRPLLEVPLSPP